MEDDEIKDFKALSFVDLMVLYDPRNTMQVPKFFDVIEQKDPIPMREQFKKKDEREEIMDSIYDLQKKLGV